MDMHIHDCYEIYYSISGGKQFLIDNSFYRILPGDIFFINQYESHYITQVDSQIHERIVFSIYPEFLKSLGYQNISSHLYGGMRHEILNEIGHEKVYQDVLTFCNENSH